MKHTLLLPGHFRRIGWLLLVPALVLGWLVLSAGFEFDFLEFRLREEGSRDNFTGVMENFTNELAALVLLFSLIFIGFARLKVEDEYTWKLRLDALLWGIYAYYFLVLITLFVFYGTDYLTIMALNLFTPLVIYILRFYYLLRTQ